MRSCIYAESVSRVYYEALTNAKQVPTGLAHHKRRVTSNYREGQLFSVTNTATKLTTEELADPDYRLFATPGLQFVQGEYERRGTTGTSRRCTGHGIGHRERVVGER